MANVVISGDTSGAITLSAPSVAGTNTLSLPAQTATLATLTTPSFATTIGVGGATAAASGAGITFPATQSASSDANTLDDYEEGTWTPSESNAGMTLSNISALYTKIGKVVFALATFDMSSSASGSNVVISGFPFTVGAVSGNLSSYITNTSKSGVLRFRIGNNSTDGTFRDASGNVLAASVCSGGNFSIAAIYFV